MINLGRRFWDKVSKTESCWTYGGKSCLQHYGRFWEDGKSRLAHRLSYEYAKGLIPDGMELDHLCRNRSCVNPDHLEVVTPKQNKMRGLSPTAKNAQKTHCPQGHPYSGENEYITPMGWRQCRICKSITMKEWWKTHKRVEWTGRGKSHHAKGRRE